MKKLVMAEKPSAAKDYAKVLKCSFKNGYYENDNYIVVNAIGHLFTLKEPGDYNEKFVSWKIEDLPIIPDKFQLKLIKGMEKQFNIIKELINRDDVIEIINGGDPAREGQLIQEWILKMAGNKKPVKRLWLASLTDEEITEGFNKLQDNSIYNDLYHAAEARSYIDWLIGMNYTRAYSLIKGNGVTLSLGRCQTCILNLIVERDLEIEKFNPIPYFEIEADFTDYKAKYFNQDDSRVSSKEVATEIIDKIKGKTGTIINIVKEEKQQQPPLLHSLTSLQMTMNKKYGFSASKTLNVAQALYETHKMLSYPRTESQHLSSSMAKELKKRFEILNFENFKGAINKIDLENLINNTRIIDDDKLTDHHALVPTDLYNMEEKYKDLSEDEKKLFDEIALNFIACFYPSYKYENTIIITEVESYIFKTVAKKEIEKGWREVYKEDNEEETENITILKNLEEGQKERAENATLLSKKTAPKKHYTEATLLAELKKYTIGTTATRSDILEILFKRDFIERDKKKVLSTKLGKDFIRVIDTKELKSVELTSELEQKLEHIALGKATKDEVIQETIDKLRADISDLLDYKGETIGIKRNLGICPICKEGNVITNKIGWGCDKYEENQCKFFIKKEMGGQKIKDEQVKKLIEVQQTDIIKGFKSKEGNVFDAAIIIKDGEIKFKFAEADDLGICPVCKKGSIRANKIGWGCDKYKDSSCSFFIRNEIAGKRITITQAKKLISKGKTDLIKGFKGKKGQFDASLIIKNGKIEFQF